MSSSSDDDDASTQHSIDNHADSCAPPPPLKVATEPPEGDDFVDNYTIEDEHNSLSQQIVHYVGGYVQQEHWVACKATLVFHAGALTAKSVVTNKAAMEQYCLKTYQRLVASLDANFFSDNARNFFLHSFKKKDQPMTAHALFRNYNDSRCHMRSAIIPLLPRNFSSMPSGKGFHETFNNIFVNAFHNDLVQLKGVSMEEAMQSLPPPLWEYKKRPWYYGLCVKVFRKDPQLAPDVKEVLSDKTNKTVSRAKLKRNRQYRCNSHFSSPSYSSSNQSSAGHTSGSNKKHKSTLVNDDDDENRQQQEQEDKQIRTRLTWAKVHSAKALQVSSKVASRLGRIDELEKTLNLLDRMRKVIGEDSYKARVDTVLASLPDPSSYVNEVLAEDPEVEVIAVVNRHCNSNYDENFDLSSEE